MLLDRLGSLGYGDDNGWLHRPGIMLGILRLNPTFDRADPPLTLGTG